MEKALRKNVTMLNYKPRKTGVRVGNPRPVRPKLMSVKSPGAHFPAIKSRVRAGAVKMPKGGRKMSLGRSVGVKGGVQRKGTWVKTSKNYKPRMLSVTK